MTKRLFDIAVSGGALIMLSPLLLITMSIIWLQDRVSPFYISPRAARAEGSFRMVKFRSMVANADMLGGSSTAASDRRITSIGKIVRAYKIDELLQLWNVLLGDMSLVGPRPQVLAEVDVYTPAERRLLTVRPGITDIASIVFSDEGEILRDSNDADLVYDQTIRPWKSRLALAYIDHQSFWADIRILSMTVCVIISRPFALRMVNRLLRQWNVNPLVIEMASRQTPLLSYPPPGLTT